MRTEAAPAGDYEPLDTAGVAALVSSNPKLSLVVGCGPLTAEEVGDGNLNQVFIVRSLNDPSRAVVVKQSLPYLRIAGEGWPLTRERMRFETQSLLLYNDLVPDLAPKVYDYNATQSWVAMEYLSGHRVMRRAVIDGDVGRGAGADLGRFMAALVHHTSEMSLDAPTKRRRSVEFSNPDLCGMQEQFVYTNPFFESEENRWNPCLDEDVRALRGDSQLKLAIATAKAQYMTQSQALLHGDLHTGSVMVAARGESSQDEAADTKVIDPEFAFYGPVAYDVGTLLANVVIGSLAHEQLTLDPAARAQHQRVLLDLARDTWDSFARELDSRWANGPKGDLSSGSFWGTDEDGFAAFRRSVIADIAADAGRHGGCELLRRCMGIVSVSELAAIEDLDSRAQVERSIIAIARRWLLDERPAVGGGTGLANINHLIDPVVQLREHGAASGGTR